MIEAFGYLASFCIGLILGLIGSGGSILSIPILIYLFSLEIVEATAYSLFIVGVTSLTGAIHRYSRSVVNIRIGLVFGIPSIVTIFCMRKWVVPAIPDRSPFTGRLRVLHLRASDDDRRGKQDAG